MWVADMGPLVLQQLKLVPDGHVTMIDINERAVELSRENAKANGITNVTVLQSNLLAEVKRKILTLS